MNENINENENDHEEKKTSGGVRFVIVSEDDNDIRIDKWFKRHYPYLNRGLLEKLLRTGQIKLDGKKIKKSGDRILQGQTIRLPPQVEEEVDQDNTTDKVYIKPEHEYSKISKDDEKLVKNMIMFEDKDIIVINKPSGLASQGGSKTTKHVDGLLNAYKAQTKERAYLVHRLDKDTSGVMVLAKTPGIASKLSASFSSRDVKKLYWALCTGVPRVQSGKITAPLLKVDGSIGEQMVVDKSGKDARSLYNINQRIGQISWLSLSPLTGRTHQLRVHVTQLDCCIIGDYKYGGEDSIIEGMPRKLHLHAVAIEFPHPRTKKQTVIKAPLSGHMKETWDMYELEDFNPTQGEFLIPDRKKGVLINYLDVMPLKDKT